MFCLKNTAYDFQSETIVPILIFVNVYTPVDDTANGAVFCMFKAITVIYQ